MMMGLRLITLRCSYLLFVCIFLGSAIIPNCAKSVVNKSSLFDRVEWARTQIKVLFSLFDNTEQPRLRSSAVKSAPTIDDSVERNTKIISRIDKRYLQAQQNPGQPDGNQQFEKSQEQQPDQQNQQGRDQQGVDQENQPDKDRQEMDPNKPYVYYAPVDSGGRHYYGGTPPEQHYYMNPCDTNDPHVYDKPECAYLRPTSYPSFFPTYFPSPYPTHFPSPYPTHHPSPYPTAYPSHHPSPYPTHYPTHFPSSYPSKLPTSHPSVVPTSFPTHLPSSTPTAHPSSQPTHYPTHIPSAHPSSTPTSHPKFHPTSFPSFHPTPHPTSMPTHHPTAHPTAHPTPKPTSTPSSVPTGTPTFVVSTRFSESQVNVLMASDGYRDAHFGHAVVVQNHRAAIGAYAEGNQGSTYVFKLSNPPDGNVLRWEQVGIVSSKDISDDYFGYAVALNNETLFVGAYRSDMSATSCGAVYVFHPDVTGTSYEQEAILTSFDPSNNEYFGYALSSHGMFTAVGAYGNNDRASNAGVVYVFSKQSNNAGFVNSARLYATDASAHDLFGSAVSLHQNVIIVGAHGDESKGTASGSAYIYTYDFGSRAWAQDAKLVGTNVGPHDYFGYSVSVHEDIALVGAYQGDGKAEASGVVFVFQRANRKSGNSQLTGWYEISKLAPGSAHTSSYFGYAVSVFNAVAIIGSPGDDSLNPSAGSAYAYEMGYGNKWEVTYKMYGKGNEYDSFGCAVSLYGSVALVGALLGDGPVTDSGTAYIFTPTDEYSSEYSKKTKGNYKDSTRTHIPSLIWSVVQREIHKSNPVELVSGIGLLAVFLVLILGFFILLGGNTNYRPGVPSQLQLALVRAALSRAVQQVPTSSHSLSSSKGGSKSKSKTKFRTKKGMEELRQDSDHGDELHSTAIDVSTSFPNNESKGSSTSSMRRSLSGTRLSSRWAPQHDTSGTEGELSVPPMMTPVATLDMSLESNKNKEYSKLAKTKSPPTIPLKKKTAPKVVELAQL